MVLNPCDAGRVIVKYKALLIVAVQNLTWSNSRRRMVGIAYILGDFRNRVSIQMVM
jgi:hypothetical protein